MITINTFFTHGESFLTYLQFLQFFNPILYAVSKCIFSICSGLMLSIHAHANLSRSVFLVGGISATKYIDLMLYKSNNYIIFN